VVAQAGFEALLSSSSTPPAGLRRCPGRASLHSGLWGASPERFSLPTWDAPTRLPSPGDCLALLLKIPAPGWAIICGGGENRGFRPRRAEAARRSARRIRAPAQGPAQPIRQVWKPTAQLCQGFWEQPLNSPQRRGAWGGGPPVEFFPTFFFFFPALGAFRALNTFAPLSGIDSRAALDGPSSGSWLLLGQEPQAPCETHLDDSDVDSRPISTLPPSDHQVPGRVSHRAHVHVGDW